MYMHVYVCVLVIKMYTYEGVCMCVNARYSCQNVGTRVAIHVCLFKETHSC